MSDIVVIGSRQPSPNYHSSEYLSIPSIVLPIDLQTVEGQTLRDMLEDRDSDSDPITIDASSDTPETEVIGANKKEAAAVVAALTNAENSPEINEAFVDMKAKNVTLHITVQTNRPSDFASDQWGQISIPTQGSGPGAGKELVPNTTIEVIVVTGRRSTFGARPPSFRSTLAHELAHLIRNPDGTFISERDVQKYDAGIEKILFKDFKTKEFLDNPDIISNVQPNPNLIMGPTYSLEGTDGDNYFLGPNFRANGSINTGDGNDLVLLGDGFNSVAVSRFGTKVILSIGLGTLVFPSGTDLTQANYERIGDDLYITFGDVGHPLLEDNLVILLDHYGEGRFLTVQVAGGGTDEKSFKSLYGV